MSYVVSGLPTQYNISKEEWINIPINLGDVYARVQADKILNWYGFDEISEESKDIANRGIRGEPGGSSNFIQANKTFAYLWKNLNKSNCNDIVNIIIPGLRNIYYSHRGLLPSSERTLLESAMKRPLPQFENIGDYGKNVNMLEFQLFGSITPYDVLHIPVQHFIDAINKRNTISVQLYPLNVIVNMVYNEADLWDTQYQQIIDKINLERICPRTINHI